MNSSGKLEFEVKKKTNMTRDWGMSTKGLGTQK